MPRQSRIDAPGALHHIMVRGIDRKRLFVDDSDREDFIRRLSALVEESRTRCYAWAQMTNHVHLLLCTGTVAIASIMRRLLTGYAIRFNRRHRRCGHLFQNRYKSILCEEDPYLKQLVAYIHLNPVRAGLVADCSALKSYPFTGYSALMGKYIRPWQDTDYVLALFGRTVSESRKNLHDHISQWSAKGRCEDLTGGGLIRSAGGWRAVKDAYQDGIKIFGDERMLGSSDFVETTLKQSQEAYDRRTMLRSAGIDLSALITAACRHLGIDETELAGRTRRIEVARARALIGYIATQELLISGSELARRLNIDRSAVSRAARRAAHDPRLIEAIKSVLFILYPTPNQQ
jgi:putative transposase